MPRRSLNPSPSTILLPGIRQLMVHLWDPARGCPHSSVLPISRTCPWPVEVRCRMSLVGKFKTILALNSTDWPYVHHSYSVGRRCGSPSTCRSVLVSAAINDRIQRRSLTLAQALSPRGAAAHVTHPLGEPPHSSAWLNSGRGGRCLCRDEEASDCVTFQRIKIRMKEVWI